MTEDGKKGIEDKEKEQDSSKKKVSDDKIKELKNQLNKIKPNISDSEINYFLLKLPKAVSSPCFTANFNPGILLILDLFQSVL